MALFQASAWEMQLRLFFGFVSSHNRKKKPFSAKKAKTAADIEQVDVALA